MSPKHLLTLCAELLREVMQLRLPADTVVSQFFRQHKGLGPRDRHILAETAFEFLRHRLLWMHLARSGSAAPKDEPLALPTRLAALAWQGDVKFLEAALDAPLRDWLAKAHAIDRSTLPEKLRHNLPDWLAGALLAERGSEGFWPLVQALDSAAPLDLRVNTLKIKREALAAELSAQGVVTAVTHHSPWGLRLQGKPAVNQWPAFKQGAFEVQDEGSQLLALLSGAGRGEMVADFCAGAGGKTLAMGAMMRNTGRLYAFDTSGHRLEALKPRLARSGLQNVYVAQIAHERDDRIKRLSGKLDRVLVDAPCSGLGTLRRNPDLKWRQSPAAIEELRAKQSAILTAAARLLKPGGRLVYATCSLLRSENEAQAEAFETSQAGAFERLEAADLLRRAGVSTAEQLWSGASLRLWPDVHGSDGFFAAVWQKA